MSCTTEELIAKFWAVRDTLIRVPLTDHGDIYFNQLIDEMSDTEHELERRGVFLTTEEK